MLPTTQLGFGDFDSGKIKIRRNFYIVMGDLDGFLDFWQMRNTESPQNQLVRKVRKVRRSSYQIWTATDRRETKKRAATSLRDGGPLQTKVRRCCEIEQNAGRRRLTKNAEAAHHRCCCT